MFEPNPISQVWGGLSVGVPGELRGLEHIHSHYGVLPWESVVQPSIEIARNGWRVGSDLLYYMDVTVERRGDFFTEDESWAVDFAPDGRRVEIGDWITRRRYADTLEVIAREGAEAFYDGAIANASIKAIMAADGVMTLDDLRDYRLRVREPVQAEYRGHVVTSCPVPAGGGAVLSILKTMEGYEVGLEEDVNLTTHRLDEAFRFAFGARSNMGDPLYVDNVEEFEREIMSKEYAEVVREKIRDDHTLDYGEYDPGKWDVPLGVSQASLFGRTLLHLLRRGDD